MSTEPDPSFERLLDHLKESRAFDFTGYKRSSLMRRVGHRMAQVGVEGYDEYLDHLLMHPDEFTGLFNTILINVTGFFRDPEVWEHLRAEVLPSVIDRAPHESIRVWSAGCAAGHEAYTLAICLAEALGPEAFRHRVKVYATDIDEEALAYARLGTFTDREVKGIPDDLRGRYFEQSGQRYAFRKDLRRCVIFGRNDLMHDAPISRIALLACRNTLMYFNTEAQARILDRLHFALEPNGVLVLGKAEMLLGHSTMFRPDDLRRRVFRKPDTVPGDVGLLLPPPQAPVPPPESVVSRLYERSFLANPLAQVTVTPIGTVGAFNTSAITLLGLDARDIGRPFQDLELSYRPVDLRSAIDQASAQRRPVFVRDVVWRRAHVQQVHLDIEVIPLVEATGAPAGVTLVFHDLARYDQLQRQLEAATGELERAYEELRSTNEELETTNEELQSTVEELETTNEELQSTNEELETMNEELQSMNDELQVTNDDLRERTNALGTLNHFMRTILTSIQQGVVVVDRELRVQVWSRSAEDLWGLRAEETVGRHLFGLDIGLPFDPVKPLLRTVLADGTGQELTVDSINRRGRPTRVRLLVTPMLDERDGPNGGALIIMEPREVAAG